MTTAKADHAAVWRALPALSRDALIIDLLRLSDESQRMADDAERFGYPANAPGAQLAATTYACAAAILSEVNS